MTIPYRDKMLERSPASESMVPYWDKVDAIIDGIDAMRLAGDKYLPRFNDEESEDYKFRLSCTKMTNVYRDIIEGLASKPFEQSVTLVTAEDDATSGAVPESIDEFSYDVDGSGNNLTVFAADTFYNGINSALHWIMVDYDKPDPSIRTVADAQASGRRAYWSHVLARNVLDVQSKVVRGKEILTYIKILEPGKPDHIREFTRTGDVVTWKLYEKTKEMKDETMFVVVDQGTLSINEIPLVPFVTGRRDGRSWKVFPAMKDAADLQVELYQQESGLKYAKVLTAFPMLAANGITPPKGADGKPMGKLAVGPNRVLWSSPDAGTGRVGNWQYIEPNAMSLEFLAKDIIATIQNLRELGRQPLTASSSNITVITAAVAAGKAKSAVKAWAYKLKDALENALRLTALFMGVQYDPTVFVFVDFDDWMEGEDVTALLTLSEKKKISDTTLWEELARRGVLSTNFTEKRERARLLKELPGDTGPDME